MKLSPAEDVPASDSKGLSLQDYERRVRLWMRTTKADPAGRASSFVMRMNSAPRQVCSSAGGDHLDDQDGVMRILEMPRTYFAPGAANAIC